MILSIIGVGLIGGSIAKSLKENNFCKEIIGIDNNSAHINKALELGIIDKSTSLDNAIKISDLIIIAVPMDAIAKLLPVILDKIKPHQTLMDMGSTKSFLKKISKHKNRGRFVATHPMAGTEYSGPEAAVSKLFDNKKTVICNRQESDPDALSIVENLYKKLNMQIIYMDGIAHDIHAAYVSHISHISSFALALTVLDKEKEEERIFDMAGGGFSSTVRLAKSAASTWTPIFMENNENLLDVLDVMIDKLNNIKKILSEKNETELYKLIQEANKIKKIIA